MAWHHALLAASSIPTWLSDPEMIEQLQRFPTSLGWISTGNVRATAGLRILAIDGLLPALESLRSGRYALWFDVVLIHRAGALIGAAPSRAARLRPISRC